MTALGDGVGEHAVDADGGSEERQPGEDRQQQGEKPGARDGALQYRFHGLQVADRQARVDGPYLLAQALRDSLGLQSRAHEDVHRARQERAENLGDLGVTKIHLGARFLVDSALVDVLDDTHDGDP